MLISQGNKKMGKNTVILNICSAHDCPSRSIGLCQVPLNRCYAYKDELRYPKTLDYRRRQEEQWDTTTSHGMGDQIILKASRSRAHRIDYLRINEAGDFRSQSDVEKAAKLANYILEYGIKTYCYTARSDLNFSVVNPEALTINGSGFMVHNMYKVIPAEKLNKNGVVCPGDCRTCSLCKVSACVEIQTQLRLR